MHTVCSEFSVRWWDQDIVFQQIVLQLCLFCWFLVMSISSVQSRSCDLCLWFDILLETLWDDFFFFLIFLALPCMFVSSARTLKQGGGLFLTLLASLPPCFLVWKLQCDLMRRSGWDEICSTWILAFERWTKMLLAKSSCKIHSCKCIGIRISSTTVD